MTETLFDAVDLGDVTYENRRYILCENPLRQAEQTAHRRGGIEQAKEKLDRLAVRVSKRTRKPMTATEIHVAADRILHPRKLNAFFDLTVEDNQLSFSVNQTAVSEAESLDGKYALVTTLEPY